MHCYQGNKCKLYHGDCLQVLAQLPDNSIDLLLSDPPYPLIERKYGMLSEVQWHILMHEVVAQTRRLLRPAGSAVFILQPNSVTPGQMRPWLWQFQTWLSKTWNIIQDVYWFNNQAVPTVHCQAAYGLLRQSVKLCVWAGPSNCFRNQYAVLQEPAATTKLDKRINDQRGKYSASGHHVRHSRSIGTCVARNGATPFNLLTIGRGGGNEHSASTPLELCSWWVKYLTRPGYTVLDPFAGSSTVGVAVLDRGCSYIGIEKDITSVALSRERLHLP